MTEATEVQPSRCTACGAEIRAGMPFCGVCGHTVGAKPEMASRFDAPAAVVNEDKPPGDVPEDQPLPPELLPPPRRFRSLLLRSLPVLAGLALAIVGIAALLIDRSDNRSSSFATPAAPESNILLPAWQKAELDADPKLPGIYIPPHYLRTACDAESCLPAHVNDQIGICSQSQLEAHNYSNPPCYNSNPPTSGLHAPNPMPFKVLDAPAPKENLLHNMEHGGVVVWYNTNDANVINQLTTWVKDELIQNKLVVMSRYIGMESNTIALTSWTRLDKFPVSDLSRKRVLDFIDTHSRRFNPEGF